MEQENRYLNYMNPGSNCRIYLMLPKYTRCKAIENNIFPIGSKRSFCLKFPRKNTGCDWKTLVSPQRQDVVQGLVGKPSVFTRAKDKNCSASAPSGLGMITDLLPFSNAMIRAQPMSAGPWDRAPHSIFPQVRLYPKTGPQLNRTLPEGRDATERR